MLIKLVLVAFAFCPVASGGEYYGKWWPGKGRDHDKDDEEGPCSQCPCYRPKGYDKCVEMDSRFEAVTEEDAVLNFGDMTNGDPNSAKPWVPKNNGDNTNGRCTSNTCKGCMQIFIDRLEATLPNTTEYRSIWTTLNRQKQTYGLNSNNYRSYCPNLHNVSQPTPQSASLNGTDLSGLVGALLGQSQCVGGSASTTTTTTATPRSGRKKRQSVYSIGTVSTMNCNYRRGNLLNDGSNYVGMCNLCNAVRTLPSQYFPRYINEVSCDRSDTRCLSGYGACREKYRSIEVLINYGTDANPRYTQYSLNTPVGCECQIQAGSALSNLVSN